MSEKPKLLVAYNSWSGETKHRAPSSQELVAAVRHAVESGTIEGRISNAEKFNDEKGWVESFVDFHGRCLVVRIEGET